MIQLAFGAFLAVAAVAAAVEAAGTVWAYPLALAAGGFGCLLVLFEGRSVR